MTAKSTRTIALFVLIFCTCAAKAALPPEYTLTQIGSLQGGSYTQPLAINNYDKVVGRTIVAGAVYHAFLWESASGLTDLGVLGNGTSSAEAINDVGQVVGTSFADNGHFAFIWDKDHGMHSIGSLNSGANWTYADGINNAGQVVGHSWTTVGYYHPYVWTLSGGMRDIVPSTPTNRAARAINNQGTVAGHSFSTGWDKAFVWDDLNGLQELGDLGGGASLAYGINDSGTVIGQSYLGTNLQHAFVWSAGDGMRDLGGLGGNESLAESINEYGTIVGWANTPSGSRRAVQWDNEVLYDLNSLIPPGSGWTLEVASGVNDSGSIVGWGISPSGLRQGFLLTPIPEPATLSLLALGGLMLLRRRAGVSPAQQQGFPQKRG